ANSGADPTHQCTFNDDGNYTVFGRIIDQDDGFTEYMTTVTVTNAPPVIENVSGPPQPVDAGAPVTLTATFTDAGIVDTHTCLVDWGDGESSAGLVPEPSSSGGGSCSATHSYAGSGTFTATVTVTDDDGGQDSANLVIDVVNAQATGGITFGEGSIHLPA